jgi:Icc-related predicted phosphoesterase
MSQSPIRRYQWNSLFHKWGFFSSNKTNPHLSKKSLTSYPKEEQMTKALFTTDIHGSEICFKKFIAAAKFYKANVLIMGGDCTGKMLVPIICHNNSVYTSNYLDKEWRLTEEELPDFERKIKNSGYYPIRLEPDRLNEIKDDECKIEKLFLDTMTKTLENWLQYAEEKLKGTGIKCIITPGNDDHFLIDEVLNQSDFIVNGENRVVWIDDHHEMLSLGWSNPTPWDTPRECSEEKLFSKIKVLAGKVNNIDQAIFNLHPPPYGSGLDVAPEMDENLAPKRGGTVMAPAGSKAVRDAIKEYQPLMGLHGHIHEAKGVQKIGRTLCANPGSTYADGSLSGLLFELSEREIKSYMLTIG